MRRDTQQAIENSGLKLEGERLEQFIERYRDERRELEEQIRREMEVVRTERLKAIVKKLRAEFVEKSKPDTEETSAEGTATSTTPEPEPAATSE